MQDLNNSSVLIIRLSAIGDTIHCLPVAAALKKKFPGCKISWLVQNDSAALLQNNSVIDEVICFDRQTFKKSKRAGIREYIRVVRQLGKQKFDVVLDLQGLLKSSLFAFLSGSKRKIGFAGAREGSSKLYTECIDAGNLFDFNEHVVDKNMKILTALGIEDYQVEFPLPEITDASREKISGLLKNIPTEKISIVAIPSTTWGNKFWIKKYWQKLLKNYVDKATIIFVGSKDDDEIINEIIEELPEGSYVNLCDKTSLLELVEVFNRSDLVIGVDTGPLHLAVACGKPKVIGVFGPTSSVRNGAYNNLNLQTDLDCQPCHKKSCHLSPEHQMKCMRQMTPEMLIQAIDRSLGK